MTGGDDDAAAASLQLQSEQSVQLLRTRRPLLHHLQAGPSWLLQLPRPVAATRRGARGFYNVLINPRFYGRGPEEEERGGETTSWVARAMGRGKSVGGIEDVQDLVGEIERLTGRGAPVTETAIDAVVMSTQGQLSRDESEALAQIDPDVPVFALEEVLPSINSLERFRHVAPIPPFSCHDPDWRAASLPPLPEWLAVSRLESPPVIDTTTIKTSSSSSSPPLSLTSNPPALLFAFAIPSPADHAAPRACPPSSCAAASKTQARGANSARALLHHNGWAPAGSMSEGAECIVFTAGSANARYQHIKREGVVEVDSDDNDDDNDNDNALLSPDAIRAVAYACPSLAVAAIMAPGAHTYGSNRRHARVQRLLRARYWIDVGDGDGDEPEAARKRRPNCDGDAWVRVHGKAGAGVDARREGSTKWYTPWRWPGAGVRWLTGRGGIGSGDGRARGKKRGLDESDEEDDADEDEDELSGASENQDSKEAHDDAPRAEVEQEDGVNVDGRRDWHEARSIDDDTSDPWSGVQRCRLGGGESIILS